MRTLVIFGVLAGVSVLVYDEVAGERILSRTLTGEEGGLDLAALQGRGELIAGLFLFLVVMYLIDPKIAIGAGILIIVSQLLAGGR